MSDWRGGTAHCLFPLLPLAGPYILLAGSCQMQKRQMRHVPAKSNLYSCLRACSCSHRELVKRGRIDQGECEVERIAWRDNAERGKITWREKSGRGSIV